MKPVTVALLLLTASFLSYGAAIDVTYTVSGSAGAWDLNFTVANNMTAFPQQDIYQFGVALSAPGVTGSPTSYDPGVYATWTNFFQGGKPISYDNIWFDGNDFNHLLPGTSLSGFTVTVADLAAPTSVSWFAFSVPMTFDPADIYSGADAFTIDSDFLTAGFEGDAVIAAPATVPEPTPLGLLVFGCAAFAHFYRRR